MSEPHTCPNCDRETERKNFRTGDVKRPGGQVQVCPGCGGQCGCGCEPDQQDDDTNTDQE